ncbi:hypothetical protein CC1G_12503 [Coprinopsis cinerea okayama7|uniref:F-box domain-containing protein n=1 Tax=Coprinopsis cinerea (strain Okayama-7 / 130 / ATCC MYA-4618 / FGSC 9003) TaxID=240176 RepID=A8PAE7_COPC7|nr:hypothetical protein CC1G_12503 [Coprinopsis cinerea okayama7\|eukprot:XP_001839974.1 hypothetical protein CC1G_12503 [Coprinopsis cinerea okayama7\
MLGPRIKIHITGLPKLRHMLTLPVDILYRILDVLATDTPTLLSGSVAAKILTAHCQRHLFRSISFRLNLPEERGCEESVDGEGGLHRLSQELEAVLCGRKAHDDHETLYKFTKTLVHNPSLGAYVRSFKVIVNIRPDRRTQTDPADVQRAVSCRLAPLLTRFTELESLHLRGDPSLRRPLFLLEEILGSVLSPNLCEVGLHAMLMHLPTKKLPQLKRLRRLVIDNCDWDFTSDNASATTGARTPLNIDTLAYYGPQMEPFNYAVDFIGQDSLQTLYLSAKRNSDYPKAIRLLRKSASSLVSLTYAVPHRTSIFDPAVVNRVIRGSLFDPGNAAVFSSLEALERFKFQVAAEDLFALVRTGHTPMSQFMLDILTGEALSACPNISFLEVEIIRTPSPYPFFNLKFHWKKLNEHLLRGAYPRLKVLRFVLNLTRSARHSDTKSEYDRIGELLAEWVAEGPLHGLKKDRGFSVEVVHNFEAKNDPRYYLF